jgi:hypothetical protein
MRTVSGAIQGGSGGSGAPAANHSVFSSDNAAPGTCSCRSAAHADSPAATCPRTGREENEAASATASQSILMRLRLPAHHWRIECR